MLGLLSQHARCRDQRHLFTLPWMVAGLLLSQSDHLLRSLGDVLPFGHCLTASWQRRAQRSLANALIEIDPL